jgi:hypothetical protein
MNERFTRTYDIERNVTITRRLLPSKMKTDIKEGEFMCYGRVVAPPQRSIHPRVVRGVTVHPKVNTAKAKRNAQ